MPRLPSPIIFRCCRILDGGRLSIAEPDSVPAGKYGRAALMALGVWSTVQDHLVPAENVRVALAYVARKEAPLGIVYKTDALSEPAPSRKPRTSPSSIPWR